MGYFYNISPLLYPLLWRTLIPEFTNFLASDYIGDRELVKAIIQKLESGDVKFDEATKLFEKGATICKELSKTFDAAKGKVTILREELMGLLKEEEMN